MRCGKRTQDLDLIPKDDEGALTLCPECVDECKDPESHCDECQESGILWSETADTAADCDMCRAVARFKRQFSVADLFEVDLHVWCSAREGCAGCDNSDCPIQAANDHSTRGATLECPCETCSPPTSSSKRCREDDSDSDGEDSEDTGGAGGASSPAKRGRVALAGKALIDALCEESNVNAMMDSVRGCSDRITGSRWNMRIGDTRLNVGTGCYYRDADYNDALEELGMQEALAQIRETLKGILGTAVCNLTINAEYIEKGFYQLSLIATDS